MTITILVTGGAGYIGSTLIPLLLSQGARVRAVDRLLHDGRSMNGFWSHPGFEFLHADLRDPGVVEAAVEGVDAVVHLAAIVGDPACARDKDLARTTNVDASLRLFEAARGAGVRRFVFASTCSNYGRMPDPEQHVDETSELRPVSFYAETKVAVEAAILAAPPQDGFEPVVLRFATVFGVGSRMRFDLTVNEFAAEAVVKGALVVYGDQFWRPYIHVRDAARAIAAVLEAPAEKVAGEVFNVGATDQNHTKADLVQMVRRKEPATRIETVERTEDPRDYRVSFEKIRARLGFATTRTVEDGVEEVVRMMRCGLVKDYDNPAYRN